MFEKEKKRKKSEMKTMKIRNYKFNVKHVRLLLTSKKW